MTSTPNNREDSDAIPPEDPGVLDLGTDSGALLATVPGILGFRPENSMVLVGLSSSDDPGERPDGVSETSSEVGPVIRADLAAGAVRAAVAALDRANRDRRDRGAVIVVVGGDAGPLVDTAVRELRGRGICPTSAFMATDLCPGSAWWEIPTDGRPSGLRDDGRDWAGGTVPALPAGPDSPGAGEPLPGQQELTGLLDPRPVPGDLDGTLPDSWHNVPRWEDAPAAPDGYRDIAGLCALVDDLADPDGAGTPDLDTRFLRLLAGPGVPAFLATVCDRRDLFPVLAVLAAGPRAPEVRTLLAGTAALSRGLLRHRALTLLSVTVWCSSGGVLAHRAAHLAVTETVNAPADRGWTTGKGRDLRRSLSRAKLTLTIAGQVVVSAEQGAPAPVITDLVDEGLGLLDRAVRHCPRENRGELGVLLDRVLDRRAVSDVRSALGRRARK